MITGGTIAATGLVLIALHFSWVAQIAIFALFGIGFYLLHGCIQVHVTDLSQTARGAAAVAALMFLLSGPGHRPGDLRLWVLPTADMEPTLFVGAAVVMRVGLVCARLLRHPR